MGRGCGRPLAEDAEAAVPEVVPEALLLRGRRERHQRAEADDQRPRPASVAPASHRSLDSGGPMPPPSFSRASAMPCGAGLQAPAFERNRRRARPSAGCARCEFTTVAIAGGPGVDETRARTASWTGGTRASIRIAGRVVSTVVVFLEGWQAHAGSAHASACRCTTASRGPHSRPSRWCRASSAWMGFYDVGRVWVDGERSSKWHHGAGGGVFFTTPGRHSLLSVQVATSEGTRPSTCGAVWSSEEGIRHGSALREGAAARIGPGCRLGFILVVPVRRSRGTRK